jgi:Transposase, Mutator family
MRLRRRKRLRHCWGDWSDPLEDGVRGRVRAFIEAILEKDLSSALGRGRYERSGAAGHGWRNGHRERQVIGTSEPTISVPRGRLWRDAFRQIGHVLRRDRLGPPGRSSDYHQIASSFFGRRYCPAVQNKNVPHKLGA